MFIADAILPLEHKSMKYDITIKSILEIGAKPILQSELCGIDLQKAKLMDLPQELFTIKLVDSPFFVEVQGKEKFILLLEWQTIWKPEKVIDLLTYKTLLSRKYKLPVKTVMVLFKKHGKARDFYKDEEVDFRFKLIKLYELPADSFIKKAAKPKSLALAPFIPLMKNGLKFLDKTLRFLLELGKQKSNANLLTGLFIFTGLVSKDKATLLREKIMSVTTESPAYTWIIEKGLKQGRLEGMETGIKKGIETGIKKGRLEGIKTGRLEGRAEGIETGIERGIKKGRAEGRAEGKLENARTMLRKGYALTDIIEITGLTAKQLKNAGINGKTKM